MRRLVVALLHAAEHAEHRGEAAPGDVGAVLRAGGDVEADVVVALGEEEAPLHLGDHPGLADALVTLDGDELRAPPRRRREDVAEPLELVVAPHEAAVHGRGRARRGDDAAALGRGGAGAGQVLRGELGCG